MKEHKNRIKNIYSSDPNKLVTSNKLLEGSHAKGIFVHIFTRVSAGMKRCNRSCLTNMFNLNAFNDWNYEW